MRPRPPPRFCPAGLRPRWGCLRRSAERCPRSAGCSTPPGCSTMRRSLDRSEPVVGYVPLDLRRWFDAYPETAAQSTWQMLRDAAQARGVIASAPTFRSELAAIPATTRRDFVEAKVREL